MREESFKEVVAEADLFGPLVGLLAVCEESPERNQSEASAEVVVTVLDIMSNCTAATNKFETQVRSAQILCTQHDTHLQLIGM